MTKRTITSKRKINRHILDSECSHSPLSVYFFMPNKSVNASQNTHIHTFLERKGRKEKRNDKLKNIMVTKSRNRKVHSIIFYFYEVLKQEEQIYGVL